MIRKKAELVLKKSLNRIKEELPFLIPAVNLFIPKEMDNLGKALNSISISTDGTYLFYNPQFLLKDFQDLGLKGIEYQILHVLMHCILGHLELDGLYKNRKLLWVVMDREVAHILEEIGYMNERISSQNRDMNAYLGECYDIGCYFKVKTDSGLCKRMIIQEPKLMIDNHQFWKKRKSKQNKTKNKEAEIMNQEGEKKQEERVSQWKNIRSMLSVGNGKFDKEVFLRDLKKSQNIGYGNGVMGEKQLVKAMKENQNSYYYILTQFFQNKENSIVSPDAFDYVLYQYGMELYGDVPLLEPPDCEENEQLNTICIAIDTSGSCSDEIASKFLRETYRILKDIAWISKDVDIYLFQCDDELQHEEHYENLEQLSCEGEMELYGFGGTSFVPVFDRVKELKEEGKQIACLIYFTDAYGDYPEEKPDYPVFFILPMPEKEIKENSFLYNRVPKWIYKIGFEN